MPANATYGKLQGLIDSGKPLQAQAQGIADTHRGNVSAIGSRLQRIRAGANLAAQRDGSHQFGGGPRGFSRQLGQAEKRGKIRQGINARGENAVRGQQLKDRLTMIRGGIRKRGNVLTNESNLARIKAGGEATQTLADAEVKAATYGAAGSIVGGAARGFQDMFNTGDLGQGIMDQQSEVDSFTGADTFGADPYGRGGGFQDYYSGSPV